MLHRLEITLKMIDTHNRRVSIRFMSLNFDIGALRAGQFCDLSIICKLIGENERRLFRTENILNTLKYRVRGKLDTLNQKTATSATPDVPNVSSGHARSAEVVRQ